MNADAGARKGPCQKHVCACVEYVRLEGPGAQPCECLHARRLHSQTWGDRPLVTVAGWDVASA